MGAAMSSGNRIGLIPCLNSDLEGEIAAGRPLVR
jgi:hypothetical protein